MTDPREAAMKQAESHQNVARTLYYEWVRQMLTLSTGALTLLVALQSNFVPQQPRFLWLLQACWMLLSLATAAAAVILHQQHADQRRLSVAILKKIADAPNSQAFSESMISDLPTAERTTLEATAEKSFPPLLAASLLALALFALLNVSRVSSQKNVPVHQPSTR